MGENAQGITSPPCEGGLGGCGLAAEGRGGPERTSHYPRFSAIRARTLAGRAKTASLLSRMGQCQVVLAILSTVQPDSEQREQLLRVDRFGDIIRRPRLEYRLSRSPFMALAVRAMIGRSAEPLHRWRIRRDRFVSVHYGHHDVHQHDVDVGDWS